MGSILTEPKKNKRIPAGSAARILDSRCLLGYHPPLRWKVIILFLIITPPPLPTPLPRSESVLQGIKRSLPGTSLRYVLPIWITNTAPRSTSQEWVSFVLSHVSTSEARPLEPRDKESMLETYFVSSNSNDVVSPNTNLNSRPTVSPRGRNEHTTGILGKLYLDQAQIGAHSSQKGVVRKL